MPLHNVEGYDIVLPDYSYSEPHWRDLGNAMKAKFGEKLYEDPEDVIQILTESYEYLTDQFEKVVHAEQRISFYIFCHNMHENSIALKNMFDKGIQYPFKEMDFISMRRALKLILEQSVKIDFKNEFNYEWSIRANYKEYIKILEEQMYLGIWAFQLSEYIAFYKLDQEHIIADLRDKFQFPYRYPNHEVLNRLIQWIKPHEDEVVYRGDIKGLFTAFQYDTGIPSEAINLMFFIMENLSDGDFRLQIPQNVFQGIAIEYNISPDSYRDILNGFILSRNNVLSVNDSIYLNNNQNRYINRPILELCVTGSNRRQEKLWLVGQRKYAETLQHLFRSFLPWGGAPTEWKKFPSVNKYIQSLKSSNDVFLEEKFCEILKSYNLLYDHKVTSLKSSDNRNTNLERKPNNIGDIDILAVDLTKKEIYVCEAKHLKARYDIKNWYRDILNFKSHHEAQLERKYRWIEAHIELVELHFQCEYNEDTINLQGFQVIPIFLINNPTLYMFDSPYRCFTLYEFERFLEDNYKEPELNIPTNDPDQHVTLRRPFIQGLQDLDKSMFQNVR